MSSDRTIAVNIAELVEKEQQENAGKFRSFTLTFLKGRNQGKLVRLDAERSYTVGRSAECDIPINDPSISRVHAMFKIKADQKLYLMDCDSTNGTFLNSSKVHSETMELVSDGDKIRIGEETLLRVNVHDKTDAEFQAAMYDAAVKDSMTNVYNKRYLIENLRRELALSHRHNTPLSLILFDADHFKYINDQHGHLAGDHVLIKLAETTSQILRKEDLIGRYGGEEFVVLTKNQPLAQAVLLAERLRSLVEETKFMFEGRRIPVTISLGVTSTSLVRFATAEDMIKAADEMLYEAKRAGRNRTAVPTK